MEGSTWRNLLCTTTALAWVLHIHLSVLQNNGLPNTILLSLIEHSGFSLHYEQGTFATKQISVVFNQDGYIDILSQ